jgi:hypothetical protein
MVALVVHHILGIRPDREGITVRPRLLRGLSTMESTVLVREHRIQLRYQATASGKERGGWLEGLEGEGPMFFPWTERGIRIPHPSSDVLLDVSC